MSPDDLTAFITARLDEDEDIARYCQEESLSEAVKTMSGDGRYKLWLARYDPARVLREVAAKRARLALMTEATAEMDRLLADEHAGRVDQAMAIGRARSATVAVKHDAAVWSDHPDYRADWTP